MNTILKKLLSGLCVMAMVLSMVPAMNLSNYTVETAAAEEAQTEEIVYGSNNWTAAGDAAAIQTKVDAAAEINELAPATVVAGNTCPMCGATDVVWADPSADETYGNKLMDHGEDTSNVAKHFKIVGDVEYNSRDIHVLQGTTNSTCIVLVDAEYTGTGRILIAGTDCTLNIMGIGSMTSDGSESDNLGLFTVQGTNATLNIYGGSYTYTGNGYGFVRKKGEITTENDVETDVYSDLYVYNRALLNAVEATTPTINLYGGTIGGALDTTTESTNIYLAAGTMNMYGGTIQNGVTSAYGYAGNVSITNYATFNMYDGTIAGGQYDTIKLPANVGGNILVGAYYVKDGYKNAAGVTITETTIDGTVYKLYSVSTARGYFYMYGGTVTDGKTNNGGNGGGNISTLASYSEMYLYGGTIKDGWAKAYGGNVQHQGGTAVVDGTVLIKNGEAQYGGNISINNGKTLTMKEGRLEGGTASKTGGSVHVRGKFIMNGGTIYGGNVTNTAHGGGNVCVYYGTSATGSMEMSGGTIDKGTATYKGGNIYAYGNTKVSVKISGDAKISNGTAKNSYGGNVAVSSAGSCTMTGGEIFGGSAPTAANVLVEGSYSSSKFYNGTFEMSGDAKVYNGTATNHAGNVRVYVGTMTMTDDAKIYGGTAGKYDTENVWLVDAALEMDGDSKICGTSGIRSSAVSFGPYRRNNTVTLKGNASICVEDGDSASVLLIGTAKHADDGVTALANSLHIDSNWTGVAYVSINGTDCERGDVIASDRASGTGYTGKLYYGADSIPVVAVGDGTLQLAAASYTDNQGNEIWVGSNAAALEKFAAGGIDYVTVTGAVEIPADMTEVTINPALGDVSISSAGGEEKVITLIDTANKDFETCSGKVTAGANVTVTTGEVKSGDDRYITISETSGDTTTYTSHYVEMALKSVSLRTTADGLYYKVEIKCDETLAKRVKQFGVAVQLKDRPTELVNGKYSYQYTLTPNTEHTVTVNSLEVFGILKDANKETDTATRIETNSSNLTEKVYANLYLICDTDGVDGIEDGESIVWEKPVAEARGYSLCDVVERINANWDDLGIKPDSELYKNTMAFVERWNSAEQLNATALAKWQAITGNIK